MIYLIPERENLFPSENHSSPQVALNFKSDTPLNGSSFASPKVGSFHSHTPGKLSNFSTELKEDEVDRQLEKMDGRIPRQRDAQLYATIEIDVKTERLRDLSL